MKNVLNIVFDKEKAGAELKERFLKDCEEFKSKDLMSTVWLFGVALVIAIFAAIILTPSEEVFMCAFGVFFIFGAIFALIFFVSSIACTIKLSKGIKRWLAMTDFEEIYDDFCSTADRASFYDMSVFDGYSNYRKLCLLSEKSLGVVSCSRSSWTPGYIEIEYENASHNVKKMCLHKDEEVFNTEIETQELRIVDGKFIHVLPYSMK